MENEEKKGCCEGKEKCEHAMANCCHNWKKCHMMKKIVWIVVIIVVFCLGSQWGEMKSESRGGRFDREGMMNWGGNRFYKDDLKQATGEVTVKVSDLPAAPAVTTPKQ